VVDQTPNVGERAAARGAPPNWLMRVLNARPRVRFRADRAGSVLFRAVPASSLAPAFITGV